MEFPDIFERFCQQNAKHEKDVTVLTYELFFELGILRHFSKLFVNKMRYTRKMLQSGPENCFSRWKLADTFRKFLSAKCKTRKMSQSGPENCFPRWKFPDIFRKFLSVKFETREKCHSLDQKIDFRVGNFRHFSKAPAGFSVNRLIGAPRRPPGSYPPRPAQDRKSVV
mgnify:CR=1 FL=1